MRIPFEYDETEEDEEDLVFGFCRFLIIPLPCSFGILLPIREPFSRHTNIYSVIEDTFQMC
jgi:hypothetical protein